MRNSVNLKDLEAIQRIRNDGNTYQLNFSRITVLRNVEKIGECEENGQPLSLITQRKGKKNCDLSDKMIKL